MRPLSQDKIMKAKKINDSKKKKDMNLSDQAYLNLNGVAGDYLDEYQYKFFKLQNEKMISKGDAYIVLGRDRPGSAISGYGGQSKSKSNSIDIVVGRVSCAFEEKDIKENALWTNPDFKNDAARIHISQRTDIDTNFDLPRGKVGTSNSKSGIALKADSIRIAARSGIKIVSSVDSVNSMGLQDTEKLGIDLIAGIPYDSENPESNKKYGVIRHKDDMQPIPKGENLVECVKELSRQLDQVTGMLASFASAQMQYNTAVGVHTHISPFYGSPTTPSPELPGPMAEPNLNVVEKVVNDIVKFKTQNITNFSTTYLSRLSPKYINSRYHNLN